MAKAPKQKLKRPHSPSPGRRRLKVFKTAAGFDDAFVAAPSRKAALAAWGAGTDLFSAGIAEEVREPNAGSAEAKAAKAALAKPGEMVRVRRGGGKEEPSPQPSPASGRGREKRDPGSGSGMTKTLKAALVKAEAALAALEQTQGAERAGLAKEEEKLARQRRALEDRQAKALGRAQAKLETAEEAYRRALHG